MIIFFFKLFIILFLGYKHCSLSDFISVLIESFLPKLHECHVQENVRYTSYFKKFDSYIPWFLKNKPKSLVANLLKKLESVIETMISSVRQTTPESNS